METFRKANGLTRYKADQDVKVFPFYKHDLLTACIDKAPQADNPEYGLQLIHDWLYADARLKIEEAVKFEEEGVLPVTKDMLKTGVPPQLEALRSVLAAYAQNPIYSQDSKGDGIINWQRHMRDLDRDRDSGEYREITVSRV